VAEGACRQVVKDRMELTGMRWTLPGAQSMLHLRVVYLNGDWDDYLDFYIQAGARWAIHEACGVAECVLCPNRFITQPRLMCRRRHVSPNRNTAMVSAARERGPDRCASWVIPRLARAWNSHCSLLEATPW